MNKNATTDKENQDPNQSRISRDEVAQRAHQLWEAAGPPVVRDMEYWLQAAGEFLAARQCGCLSDAGHSQASLKLERSRPRVSAAPGSKGGAKKTPSREQNQGDICLDAEGGRLGSAPHIFGGVGLGLTTRTTTAATIRFLISTWNDIFTVRREDAKGEDMEDDD